MKLKSLLTFFLLIIVFANTQAQKATKEHKDSLNSIIDQYYELNVKIFQAGSTVDDIKLLFELFTDDFIYTHPKYGGEYSRKKLYNGYVRNQKEGRYNGNILDIKVQNRIVGLNAVTAEKIFVTNEDGKRVNGEAQMTFFEFRDGKISRIFEYW